MADPVVNQPVYNPPPTTATLTGTGPTAKVDLATTSLKFPHNLGNPQMPYCMTFGFYKYERPSIFNAGETKFENQQIRLPIPNALADSQQVVYSQEATNLIVGAAVESLAGAKDLVGGAANLLAAVGTGAAFNLINNTLAPGVMDRILQFKGLAINPFLTVLFKSPAFKRYDLGWMFAPSNVDDAVTLMKIQHLFKYHSLPELTDYTNGVLLGYPSLLGVTIEPKHTQLATVLKFKPMVIESVTMNHVGGGAPAFFDKTQTPMLVEFRLNLLEIEYWTKTKDFLNNKPLEVIEEIEKALRKYLPDWLTGGKRPPPTPDPPVGPAP